MTQQKHAKRRRGTELETALLSAAWSQLQALGYQKLTMEGIAAAAHTTKTVIYRRWSKKALIVIAAFKRFGPTIDFKMPDTGDLRTDLYALLTTPVEAFSILGRETVQGLIADQIGESINEVFMAANSNNNWIKQATDEILAHAESRGEIEPDQISERIKNLPVLLLVNEILANGTLTKTAVAEIVDTILMPLFKNNGDK
ncbi:MAG: TetR/AcrR family transcriptional regulator [Sporolactobacillus sp.]